MFRRTRRASMAWSITCVVVAVLAATLSNPPDSRPSVFVGRRSEPRLHVRDGVALLDAVHQRRIGQAAPRQPLDPPLRVQAVTEKDERGEEGQRVDPEAALGEEAAPELGSGDRPRLPSPRGKRACAAGPALSCRTAATSYSPPIRYSYKASTFSSAGTTPSMRCPSSAICPSARANCSRSRVITSSPRRSSFSLISVM